MSPVLLAPSRRAPLFSLSLALGLALLGTVRAQSFPITESPSSAMGITVTVSQGGANDTYYVVNTGDTLYGLARRGGWNVDLLKAMNGISTQPLIAGQTLKLPGVLRADSGQGVIPTGLPLTKLPLTAISVTSGTPLPATAISVTSGTPLPATGISVTSGTPLPATAVPKPPVTQTLAVQTLAVQVTPPQLTPARVPTKTTNLDVLLPPTTKIAPPPASFNHGVSLNGGSMKKVNLSTSGYLAGVGHSYQTQNNCGPASVSAVLEYFHRGVVVDQDTLRQFLRPSGGYMSLSVITPFLATHGLRAPVLQNGTIPDLLPFLKRGYPVIVLQYMKDMGKVPHIRVIRGFDEQQQRVWMSDSMYGPATSLRYSDFDRLWATQGRSFVPVYPFKHTLPPEINRTMSRTLSPVDPLDLL